MSKENSPAPSAREATEYILKIMGSENNPEAVLVEMYLEMAFLLHRSEETQENYKAAGEVVKKVFNQ